MEGCCGDFWTTSAGEWKLSRFSPVKN
jgi:hypothetical protein